MAVSPASAPRKALTAPAVRARKARDGSDRLVMLTAYDAPGSVQVVDEVERWCFACRTHYPHEAVDPG